MKLNARLSTIADNIPHCRILSDIGTDHAYIPIYSVEKGLCDRAIAADLREGPLTMAAANIKRHDFSKCIEIRLGNGLEPISCDECDVVVIAGMGGTLIRDILSASFEKAQRAKLLLLQPNNAADVLRKWLSENGFEIRRETLALDAGKLYCLICAKWTGKVEPKDDFYYYTGDLLVKGRDMISDNRNKSSENEDLYIDNRDSLLVKYIEKKINELDVVINGRSKSSRQIKADVGSSSIVAGMSIEECQEVRDRLRLFIDSMVSK